MGLVVPQSGVYAALGTDMQRGWQLWLDGNGGRFGDRTVETVVADEGESPQTGVPAVQKVLQSDNVDVVVGLVNSATALGVRDLLAESRKLLIVTNAGAEDVTGKGRTPYIWRSSFTNGQVAAAMGTHLAESGFSEGVYAIAPDYAAGTEVIAAFTKAFETGGGRVVGQAKPPFGTTSDYQPFLTGIQDSGARATFCFFSGAEAITFVRQYSQFGLATSIPLYGSGLPHRGQRPAAAGRRRAGRADDAALHRPARQPGQPVVRRGVHRRARRAPELLLGADVGRGERPRTGPCRAARRSTATRSPRRSAASARSRTARAARGRSRTRRRGRTSTCAGWRTPAGTLVNAVVQDLGQQSQPAA